MAFIFNESHDSPERFQVELDRLRRDSLTPGRWVVWQHSQTWRPPTDVYETDEAVVVRVEIAGMREADFTVTLRDQLLIVTGTRIDPSPKVAYHQLEVRYGDFRTEVYLHWSVEAAAITAVYEDGFLVVMLPKARQRRVPVVDVGRGE
jgi:HSP20 family protein